MTNGLGSPSCRPGGIAPTLGSAEQRNCSTSGFIGSAAPTGNYGIDVHIDTGLLGLSSGGLLSVVQDLLVTPVWMAIVWIIHALVVMLEWSFSLDLVAANGGALRADLVHEQSGVTVPWLPLALAVAALLIAYRGLVRRSIADSLGEALAMAAMIAAGLWLTFDPAGTVGTVSRWADQAAVGTLAVAAQGSPASPDRALGASMSALFATAVEAPWCYLEFGDVRWCKDPARLDPELKAIGAKIAARELREGGCGAGQACPGSPRSTEAVRRSARLLDEARSNGALFLALPPNGPARNSINDEWSLLRALCKSDEATSCRGATSAQAQFRTNGGTWSRVGGLLLISLGMLGLILLLGHLALRLLTAAAMSLLYLLLAPAAVLAPAFGERGRELFRAWAARLFAATVSKLVYAFLLGVVLTLMSLLGALGGIGWWAQWLLMSAFWWSAFLHRHELRSLAGAAISRPGAARHRPLAGRVVQTYGIAGRIRRHQERTATRLGPEPPPAGAAASPRSADRAARPPAPPDGRGGYGADGPGSGHAAPRRPGPPTSPVGPVGPGGPGGPSSSAAGPSGSAQPGRPPESGAAASAAAQLARIDQALSHAAERGERRRVALLETRRTRVAAAVDARPAPAAPSASLIAAQARLPPRGARDRSGARRDYAALAPLVGIARDRYEGLSPPLARTARLEVDRELAARRAAAPPVNEIWEDIKAVSDGRKRQLGIGKP